MMWQENCTSLALKVGYNILNNFKVKILNYAIESFTGIHISSFNESGEYKGSMPHMHAIDDRGHPVKSIGLDKFIASSHLQLTLFQLVYLSNRSGSYKYMESNYALIYIALKIKLCTYIIALFVMQ